MYSIPLLCNATYDLSWPSEEITARKNHGTPNAMMIANDDAPTEFETPTLLLPAKRKIKYLRKNQSTEVTKILKNESK